MGLPRLGGHGGNGGDVWVVATKNTTLKRLKDRYPQKRFVAGIGANSRFVSSSSSSKCFFTAQCQQIIICQRSCIISVFIVEMFFMNSVQALKGERGQDVEIMAPVGVTVTTDDGKKLGMPDSYNIRSF